MCVAGSCCRYGVLPAAVAAWLKFGKACRKQWSRIAAGRPGEEQATVTRSTRTLVPRKGSGKGVGARGAGGAVLQAHQE